MEDKNMRARNKKYLMMVYSEDERYSPDGEGLSLGFYSDNPAEGLLQDIVFGNNVDELMICSDEDASNEGLFYILYAMEKNCFNMETGIKISHGTIDRDCIKEEIMEYERKNKKKRELEMVLYRQLSDNDVESIRVYWGAFYSDPFKYDGSVVVDLIKEFLRW